jgi:hypothetical protein
MLFRSLLLGLVEIIATVAVSHGRLMVSKFEFDTFDMCINKFHR